MALRLPMEELPFRLLILLLPLPPIHTGNKPLVSKPPSPTLKPVFAGDTLTATVIEKNRQQRIALYEVNIYNQSDDLVALFRGTVYRKKETWDNFSPIK